ncbi:hypothetical protein N7474_010873 [Penicillium riverlandense]|uniref:uncharacterized protein n=1 Tax=Penicillium riverlandense TaxID=1903569 RepID=UPI0025469976|nr:uncharacterized protein N7474_010873 [Penicillium riverlandense]KAJ5804986.1 hypothetical protein N7474_010873 [Penicillium riverlandense]
MFFLSMLAIVTSLVSALPTPVQKRTDCTFTSAASAIAGKKSCSTIVLEDIHVPAGETLDLSDLEPKTKVVFAGETSFGYKEWDGPLIRVSGSNIVVVGTTNHTINGGGERWWDGQGTNGGKTKPKFFYAHGLDNSLIAGLNVKNTPVQAFSIESNHLLLTHITIDDSDGDDLGAHNTDAFDVGDSTHDILFTGAYCFGGHGLSIGSVGGRSNNKVENVKIEKSTVVNSQNGIRIKTDYKQTGLVSGVTFSNIRLSNILDHGIVIEQDYENGSPTGTPTTGIPITDLTVENITGSVQSDAAPVYILCGDGSCSDWKWEGVDLSGGQASDKCENMPDGIEC